MKLGPLGLADRDRLERVERRALHLGVVEVAALGRDVEHLVVDELEHAALDHVDVGAEPVDRMRPAVVGFVLPHEGEHADDAAPAFVVESVVARGERCERHLLVRDAALRERGVPLVFAAEHVVDRFELDVEDRRLPVRAVDLVDADHLAGGQRHAHVVRRTGCLVEDDRAHDAREFDPGEHSGLRRLVDADVDEPGRFADEAGRGEHLARRDDLVCREPAASGRRQARSSDAAWRASRWAWSCEVPCARGLTSSSC